MISNRCRRVLVFNFLTRFCSRDFDDSRSVLTCVLFFFLFFIFFLLLPLTSAFFLATRSLDTPRRNCT